MLQSKSPKKSKPSRSKTRAKKPAKTQAGRPPGFKGSPKKPVDTAVNRPHSARSETKQQTVLALLRQPAGTTIAAMAKATGWQAHSVRGFLTGVVRKRLMLKLESAKVNGERVYRVPDEAPPTAKGSQSKHRATWHV